jgi:ribosomal protein L11 methyltransferase
MDCIEIQIPAVIDSGELVGMLPEGECLGAWECDGLIHLFWPESGWRPEIRRQLESTLKSIGVDIPAGEIIEAKVEDRDWNVLWAQSVQPIRIGQKVLIRQSWNQGEIPAGGFELIIEPKRAFGTGFHATTQLLVEFLEARVAGGETVLDIGTGSGVLAMVALKLGAARAIGVDNDPVAIECAKENAAINGFGDELELKVASLVDPDSGGYDLIAANLDRKTILAHTENFGYHIASTGKLLLSGLQVGDEEDVAVAFLAVGGRVVSRRQNGEWIALEIHFNQ